VPPPPLPELALILHSLEAINETLKGRQPAGTEVEPPPSGMGNLEASRDSGGGPPPEDITQELQKIKLLEFVGGRASERAEVWLEGMTRCFSLRDYTSNSKAKIAIFQLRDSTLNWWGNLERQLHVTPDIVSWELFEERFRRKYLPAYYEEQWVGAFHALVQGNRTVEEYEIRFMELVKHVSYMDNNQRQAERFIYELNPKIRAMVRMWKPSSVAEVVENACYMEEHMNLTGGTRPTFSHRPGFVGKAPRTFPRGGGSRPPPYGNGFATRIVVARISMAVSAASRSSPATQTGPQPSQGTMSRGRSSRGRNSFQRQSHNNA
jgi:hypothetical protein